MEALRKSHHIFIEDKLKTGENLSLRLHRLNSHVDEYKNHDQKDNMLDMLLSFSLAKDNLEAYKYAYNNWKKAVKQKSASIAFVAKTETKALLGIGNASIHEFGVQLNHPWGVPYLSGSSIKGLLSSYLHRHGGDQYFIDKKDGSKKSALMVELFGGDYESEEDNRKSYIGSVIFNDAWWVPESNCKWFMKDIITSHHMDYYAQKRFPDGTENPNPVTMAALKPGLSFYLSIEGSEQALRFLLPILEEALKEEGIGAKTATGYGRFVFEQSIDNIWSDKSRQLEKIKAAQQQMDMENAYKNMTENQQKCFLIEEKTKQLESLLASEKEPRKNEIYRLIAQAEKNIGNWSSDESTALAEAMFNFFEQEGWHEAKAKGDKIKKQRQKKEDRINRIRNG